MPSKKKILSTTSFNILLDVPLPFSSTKNHAIYLPVMGDVGSRFGLIFL